MKRQKTVGRQKQFYLLRGKIAVSVNAVSFLEEPSFWNDWDLTKIIGEALKKSLPFCLRDHIPLIPKRFATALKSSSVMFAPLPLTNAVCSPLIPSDGVKS